MKVFFAFQSAQEHPKLGLLKPGENDIPEGDDLDAAIKSGLLQVGVGEKSARPGKKEKE